MRRYSLGRLAYTQAADDMAGAEEMAEYEQKLEEFTAKALQDGKIPDSELLGRFGDRWVSQYESPGEFYRTQRGSWEYVNGDHRENGWNQAMVKSHIRIENFETITGNVGHGHEMVLLHAARDKLVGTYNSSEPVRRFHDWIATKYTVPDTIRGIDARLLEIREDRFSDIADEAVRSFEDTAEHGNVPSELFESDWRYWIMTANIAMCGYDPSCDPDVMRAQEIYTLEDRGDEDEMAPHRSAEH